MAGVKHLQLEDVERRVCDIAAKQLGFARERISPGLRIMEDLHIDSLDLIELFMEIEQGLDVTLPENSPNPVYKSVFTRQPFRLADFAELVYLQQGTGAPDRKSWRANGKQPPKAASPPSIPFTQLGGRWLPHTDDDGLLFDWLPSAASLRRRSDGMRCVILPSALVTIGCDAPERPADERPWHVVAIDSFLIDCEPVSTTAYCRFLNSIDHAAPEILADWFILDPSDKRNVHMPIEQVTSEWRPLPGTERWPMILVSWYGANAYSLWANGQLWRDYRGDGGAGAPSFLPSEAQWEYAARGDTYHEFPWGDEPPAADRLRFDQHFKGATYRLETLPMADVNDLLGMSPFGLHHMAGNVWQWCRDWYDEAFYSRAEASLPNSVNLAPGTARSERGGSWIGPASLCRSSYRRGRPPGARGRCLGFRCVSFIPS